MKKALLFGLLISLFLFATSCKDEELFFYEAYVTIVNGGDVVMQGAVEGNWENIPVGSSVTWGIELDSEYDVIDVLAEARPVGYDGYDSMVIRVSGDRDVQTWLTGWYRTSGSQVLSKVESRLISGGQAGSQVIRRVR